MKSTTSTTSDLLQETISGVASLVEQGAQLTLDLLNGLTNTASASIGRPSGSALTSMLKAPSRHSCCKIPPPCWLPRSAGHVVSHVCAGSSASTWISVTNCGMGKRVITFDDAGKGLVTFSPISLTLGPLESGDVKATFTPPATASDCEDGEQTVIVWVHGCKEHYFRWTLKNVRRGVTCSCHEICIEDCPDYLHHWYDHFYCARPCASQGRKG